MNPTTETDTEIIFEGDLILTKDFTTQKNLIVKGNIKCEGSLWNINARNIKAGDIDARNINAGDINAGDINAWDINAWDINTGNINAGDINAGDINAWDINTGNINAGDIIYYAVCFAYNNIVCNSIKGTRNNCKHFCLDGKITIKEETKCKTCGK